MDTDNTVGGVAIESTQLLACPFCGCTPVVEDLGWSDLVMVACQQQACPSRPFVITHNSRSAAVSGWNQRTAVVHADLMGCPFCGERPEMIEARALGYSELYCGNRECPARPTVVSRYTPDVVARWNTRDANAALEPARKEG